MTESNMTLLFTASNVSDVTLPMHKTAMEITELIFLSLIAFFTLFGNIMIMMAFIFGPRNIRIYMNYFVLNLAVSDLMVGIIPLPCWIIQRIDPSLISDQLFGFLISLDVLFGITSIYNLVAISVERVVAVKAPSTYRNLSQRPVIAVIIATWIIGLIFSGSRFGVPDEYLSLFTAATFSLTFMVPLLVIIISYCVIFNGWVYRSMSGKGGEDIRRQLRLAKMISFIISVFIICWLPFFLLNMISVFCAHCSRPHLGASVKIVKMLHYSNSMMNFFIYGYASPLFRRYFRKVLCPCRK